MKKPFNPNFHTDPKDYCREEKNKSQADLRGHLPQALKDASKPDLIWEAEQVAKSYGIYLEFNRAKTGSEKDWRYMIRLTNPGGGPINRKQWLVLDELSEKYTANPEENGATSLRLTTRQNIQFHWLTKEATLDIVKRLAEAGLSTLNGCGDNTRNVMGCPLSRHSDIFDSTAWARKIGEYFQLPIEPFIEIFALDPHYLRKPEESFQYGPTLLNRKFKIAFSTIHRDPQNGQLVADNCVEALTNDVAVIPIMDSTAQLDCFQIYIGGGQADRNGKPSLSTLARPLGQVKPDHLINVLDAIVHVHQEWGDRQNRHWARLKFVVKKMGLDWYRERVAERVGDLLHPADPGLFYGRRHMHHGWHHQPANGLWAYGIFVENGRITDTSPNGKLKTMLKDLMQKYPIELMVTPNQDVLLTNIPEESREAFEADLATYGYGQRNGRPYSRLRTLSGACVGRDTCRLTYTDSEKFEPFLIDELEKMGWGDMTESIGITGCERQCFRPATKTIGLVGSGLNRYQFRLGGDESGCYQGRPLISGDGQEMYLRSIPRESVALVIDALFQFYKDNAADGEGMGAFHRRIGPDALIAYLKENPATTELMVKPFNTDCVIEENHFAGETRNTTSTASSIKSP